MLFLSSLTNLPLPPLLTVSQQKMHFSEDATSTSLIGYALPTKVLYDGKTFLEGSQSRES